MKINSNYSLRVFTTLIGNSIQDHLFETQTLTTSFPNGKTENTTIPSSNKALVHAPHLRQLSSPDEISSGSTEQVMVSNEQVVRRNVLRGSRNRKSAVYGRTSSEEAESLNTLSNGEKLTGMSDLNIQLLTVSDGGGRNGENGHSCIEGVTLRTGTVSAIAKQFNDDKRIKKTQEKEENNVETKQSTDIATQDHRKEHEVFYQYKTKSTKELLFVLTGHFR